MPSQGQLDGVGVGVAGGVGERLLRHADAHAVELSLRRQGGWVVLEVTDDGRGFEGLVEGSGLMGMRERAALVRAELSVISQPRRGTTVRLRVPVSSEPEGDA